MAKLRLTARGSVWFSKEDGKTCIEGSFIAEGRYVKKWFELGEVWVVPAALKVDGARWARFCVASIVAWVYFCGASCKGWEKRERRTAMEDLRSSGATESMGCGIDVSGN
jgi:hypothetical protein